MKKLVITAAMVIGSLYSFANMNNLEVSSVVAKSQIEGRVVDKTTGEALAGVAIQLQGCDSRIFTDLNGNFSIPDVDMGTYNLDVSYVSYQNVTLKAVNANALETNLKVELESVSSDRF